jgi:hypothetical protein
VSAPISRRRLLLGAGAALPAVLLPLRPWRALVELAPPPAAAVRLAGVLGHGDSARAVGREYLRVAPAPAHELTAAVAARLPGGRRTLAHAGDDELRTALARCVREDFQADAVVALRGWIVSRTEAQLCALTALAPRRR